MLSSLRHRCINHIGLSIVASCAPGSARPTIASYQAVGLRIHLGFGEVRPAIVRRRWGKYGGLRRDRCWCRSEWPYRRGIYGESRQEGFGARTWRLVWRRRGDARSGVPGVPTRHPFRNSYRDLRQSSDQKRRAGTDLEVRSEIIPRVSSPPFLTIKRRSSVIRISTKPAKRLLRYRPGMPMLIAALRQRDWRRCLSLRRAFMSRQRRKGLSGPSLIRARRAAH